MDVDSDEENDENYVNYSDLRFSWRYVAKTMKKDESSVWPIVFEENSFQLVNHVWRDINVKAQCTDDSELTLIL